MKSKLLLLFGAGLFLIGLSAAAVYVAGDPLQRLQNARTAADREKALVAYFSRFGPPNSIWQRTRDRVVDLFGSKTAAPPPSFIPGSSVPSVVDDLLAKKRFSEASELVASLPGFSQRGSMTRQIAREWILADEANALAWLRSLSASVDRSNALAATFEALAVHDPTVATQCALSLADPFYRRVALSNVVLPLIRQKDDPALVRWLKSGIGRPEFDAARSLAIADLAGSNPKAAASLLNDMVDPKMKDEAARAFYRKNPGMIGELIKEN